MRAGVIRTNDDEAHIRHGLSDDGESLEQRAVALPAEKTAEDPKQRRPIGDPKLASRAATIQHWVPAARVKAVVYREHALPPIASPEDRLRREARYTDDGVRLTERPLDDPALPLAVAHVHVHDASRAGHFAEHDREQSVARLLCSVDNFDPVAPDVGRK